MHSRHYKFAPPFALGSTVYMRPRLSDEIEDKQPYTVIGHVRAMFGEWDIELVPNSNLTAPAILHPWSELTGIDPWKVNRVIGNATTRTGNTLRMMSGGLDS